MPITLQLSLFILNSITSALLLAIRKKLSISEARLPCRDLVYFFIIFPTISLGVIYEYWPISSAICLSEARLTFATVFLMPSLSAYRLIIIFSSSSPVRDIQLSNV